MLAVVEDALSLRIQMQPSVFERHRERRFRLEKQVLDTLGAPGAGHDVSGRRERGIDFAALNFGQSQDVVALGVDLRRSGLDRRGRIEHGRQHFVIDRHQCSRRAGDARCLCGDDGNDVADVAYFLALGDHDCPVAVDLAHPAVAGNVFRRCDAHDARQCDGLAGIDAEHAGTSVGREHHRAVEHAVDRDIGDECACAQCQFHALIAAQALAHCAAGHRLRQTSRALGFQNRFDRIDDLDVSGAAAELCGQGLGDLLPRHGLMPIRQPLGAQDETRRAESALQRTGCLEGLCIQLAFFFGYALEREHRLARHLVHGHDASVLRRAVDQREARTALSLGCAAVLDRGDLEILAQYLEQGLIGISVDLTGYAVHGELVQLCAHIPSAAVWSMKRAALCGAAFLRMAICGHDKISTSSHQANFLAY